MKVEDFVLQLKTNTPSITDYIKSGYSEKLARKTVNTFDITKMKDKSNFDDELLKLIDCYNVKNLEIGIVKFYEHIIENPNYLIVGEVEADWLIFDKLTGMIKVVELYSEQNLWDCATNGSKFLDAMLKAKLYIMKSSLDVKSLRDKLDCVTAEECRRLAGSEGFLDFYKMLLGCFE